MLGQPSPSSGIRCCAMLASPHMVCSLKCSSFSVSMKTIEPFGSTAN